MEALQELLTDALKDLYDAEKQLIKALPRLARAASSQELKQAFTDHTEVTQKQVARLEQAFEQLGERAKGKSCKGMQGLVEEAQEHLGEHGRGPMLDGALLASAAKVEHYEIASYMSARSLAKTLGQREVVGLLQETLREEEQMGKLVMQTAERMQKEMKSSGGDDGGGSGRSASTRGGGATQQKRGGAASKKSAGQKSGQGSAKKSGASSARKSGGGRSGSLSRGGSASSGGALVTTDHEEIRRWAEERGAKPACVRGTGGKGDTGMIRLDFPGYSGGESLQEISWDDWFEKFDQESLALLRQETTARGQKSNFNKLVARETAEARTSGDSKASRRGSRAGRR
jgi:ferritin-like metal-binding protein YciE